MTETGANTLDNQVTLKLSNRSEYREYHLASRRARVDLLRQGYELNSKRIQSVASVPATEGNESSFPVGPPHSLLLDGRVALCALPKHFGPNCYWE
jgi:hypothetical protein